jgi:hypothetical protein
VTDPELERIRTIIRLQREFAQLYAQLSILPYGSTQNYNGSGARSSEHPGGRRPVGEAHPEAERLLDAWTAAQWRIPAMERALEQGRDDLAHWKHSKRVEVKEETPGSLYRRIRDEGAGWPVAEVARALKVTERQVRKARFEGGLHPETGRERVIPAALSPEARRTEVLRLVNAGWKAKNVAMHLGVAYKTVLRDLDTA